MIKVCIDPGHGGKDRYNRGPSGYIEADGVLKISRYLKEELESTGEVEVILTRDGDETLGLTQRATIGVNNKVDLFISQHTNAGPASAGGAEAFYSVDIPGDESFAAKLSSEIASALGIRNRGAKKRASTRNPGEDYYTVIDVAQDGGIPHVLLVESAFHSNPEEEKMLLQDQTLRRIAEVQADVICSFFGIERNVKGISTEEPSVRNLRYMSPIMTGEDVEEVQTILKNKGFYTGEIDGRFGPLTDKAVRSFQSTNGLEVDGVVGPLTRGKLRESSSPDIPQRTRSLKYTNPIMTGEDVREVQTILKNKGFYTGEIDGRFGPLTDKAVRSFQSANGLEVDGSVGPITWAKLHDSSAATIPERTRTLKYSKPTMKGEDVKMVQQRLKAKGFDPGPIDGSFGRKTDAAVRSFQRSRGLEVDGSVGPITWRELFS